MKFSEMQVRAHRDANRAAELGLTAQDIAAMPAAEFNRMFGYNRPTPAQAARAALEAQYAAQSATETPAEPTAAPTPAPASPAAPDPFEGLDPGSAEYFLAWRAQRPSGGEGRGIFDSVSSRSAEYQAAARKQAGRTGWANSNVVEPPRIGRAFINHDDRLDHRSAADRLSNQANMWQGR